MYYKLDNIYFKIPTFGYIIKIIDWGRATYNFKNIIGKNTIFSSKGECFGQYVYKNLKGRKAISELNKNKWSDIVIISHNLLYEFPEYMYSGIGKLLLSNITNSKNEKLDFNKFDWSIYRTIGLNKFNIKVKSLIRNRVFSKYI